LIFGALKIKPELVNILTKSFPVITGYSGFPNNSSVERGWIAFVL